MSNNPQVNLYKCNLGPLYNYYTTGLNLYKYVLAAEPLQVKSLKNFLPAIADHNQTFITSINSLILVLFLEHYNAISSYVIVILFRVNHMYIVYFLPM